MRAAPIPGRQLIQQDELRSSGAPLPPQAKDRRAAASTGSSMTFEGKSAESKRVLVVEDELMIRMLLQDMLTDLGHAIAAETGRIEEALALAKQAEFDVAILDVNLNGQPVTPVVEVLLERGLPFVFATGYGQ